jgi:hypothetical protein
VRLRPAERSGQLHGATPEPERCERMPHGGCARDLLVLCDAECPPLRSGAGDMAETCDDELEAAICYSHASIRDKVVQYLTSNLPIDDRGELKWFLRMKVTRDRTAGTVTLSQEQYIDRLLDKHSTWSASARRFESLMDERAALSSDGCPTPGSAEHADFADKRAEYMTVVGSLLWIAACTRPDLSYTVSTLVARFVGNPGGHTLSTRLRFVGNPPAGGAPHYQAMCNEPSRTSIMRATRSCGSPHPNRSPTCRCTATPHGRWTTRYRVGWFTGRE